MYLFLKIFSNCKSNVKLVFSDESVVERVNAQLPSAIRIIALTRVQGLRLFTKTIPLDDSKPETPGTDTCLYINIHLWHLIMKAASMPRTRAAIEAMSALYKPK